MDIRDGAPMRGDDLIDSSSNDDKLLHTMKMRIVESYRWRVDIVEPLAKELNISKKDLEEILIKRLDMSSLEALHPRYESSKERCYKERIHADLRLCWLSDVMNLLDEEETNEITTKIAREILMENKSYDKALEDGWKDLLEYLMR
jgi:energy-converting hydrogenase A subunit M